MAPNERKMTGPELVGRVAALEGLVMVLVEALLDRPDITLEERRKTLAKMTATGKVLARQLGHTEAQVQGESYANEMSATIERNLAGLRDGKPG